jgi:phospholipase/carboxylesterase
MPHPANSPHQGQPILAAGEPLESAKAVMILIHGRGATAESILSLVPEIDQPGVAYLAPQAANYTWYPNSFLMPLQSNEPGLSSALAVIEDTVAHVEASGIAPEKITFLGFSQGACLSTEYVARHAQRYGGLFGLSGGLIGPDATPHDYPGSLAGTPVFLGCSDVDFHIPKERVLESADVFRKLGGEVTTHLYPNMGHTVNEDELDFVRSTMAALVE